MLAIGFSCYKTNLAEVCLGLNRLKPGQDTFLRQSLRSKYFFYSVLGAHGYLLLRACTQVYSIFQYLVILYAYS